MRIVIIALAGALVASGCSGGGTGTERSAAPAASPQSPASAAAPAPTAQSTPAAAEKVPAESPQAAPPPGAAAAAPSGGTGGNAAPGFLTRDGSCDWFDVRESQSAWTGGISC